MSNENKDLLLKDLCARLPYGVFAWYHSYNGLVKGYEEATEAAIKYCLESKLILNGVD